MKSQVLLALSIGTLLVATVCAQHQENRFQRQSDFNFPGPRRQTPATLPVFSSDEGQSRPRSRPSFRQEVDSGDIIDDGGSSSFQEEPLPPPSRSFRPSSRDLQRFVPRQQSSSSQDDLGPDGKLTGGQELLEEEIKPEPDRLEMLLKDSKFSCSSKKQGYYADDGLSCEVFHYCNEGVRHSWMCPAGTLFHQIHLICMQEGGDNICKDSSKYYIVNDYLYKPLTDSTKENNGTIRYADRYYPDELLQDNGGLRDDGQSFHQGGSVSQQEDISDFQRPQQRPQPEFFDSPPPRVSSGSAGRFRPIEDDSQFGPPRTPSFSSGSRGSPQGSTEDLGSTFASEEDSRVHFQPPPPNRFRSGGRQSSRGQQFPHFDRS